MRYLVFQAMDNDGTIFGALVEEDAFQENLPDFGPEGYFAGQMETIEQTGVVEIVESEGNPYLSDTYSSE